MKTYIKGGKEYKLASILTPFQLEMQMHLVDWKWAHVTREPGLHNGHPNDAILPEPFASEYPMLYPGTLPAFCRHKDEFPFHLHQYFNHVASSQVANLNLFLPILLHSSASTILRTLNPDFARLALSELDHGYQIEYWDKDTGNLADHNQISGTDADIAIAYYNHQNELCLWLIEHKLTEKEFTICRGSKSRGRQAKHDCSKSFSKILADKQLCYCHDVRHYNFWNITEANRTFFVNHIRYLQCPFQGGMYQLWRNQLLGLSIEQDERLPYRHVTFSVVKHPRNTALNETLAEYRELIASNPKFSVFTSADVIAAAAAIGDPNLDQWIAWYRDLYAL
jgi:hypothetical protein